MRRLIDKKSVKYNSHCCGHIITTLNKQSIFHKELMNLQLSSLHVLLRGHKVIGCITYLQWVISQVL